MKTTKITLVITIVFAFLVTSVAYAATDALSAFVITPNPAFSGETLTFAVDIDGYDSTTLGDEYICFYSNRTDYGAFASSITSVQGDTWTKIVPVAPCATAKAMYQRTADLSNNFGEFGDTINFTVISPAASRADTWQARFFDETLEVAPRKSASVQLVTSSSVYVANDTATCAGNTPCFTGTTALNRSIDGVTSGGTITIIGNYLQDATTTADLSGTRVVTIVFSGSSLGNGAGTCTGPMVSNVGSGTLTINNSTIDGTCTLGSRSTGVLNSGTGTTNVTGMTVRDFTGSGNAGVEVTNGTLVAENNTFINNEAAMEQSSSGILYAFANNVSTNTGGLAAVASGTTNNVKCNYWGSYSISASLSADYAERLGSAVVSYVEGTGSLVLGNASLAGGSGSHVLINLGRNTVNPPFNNGTTTGLGALVSDFFAACQSRNGSLPGTITIVGDNQTPGLNGFRLYEIMNVTECSPADNTHCWDYAGALDGSGYPTGTMGSGDDSICWDAVGCSVVDETASEGLFVVGNELDPTAISLKTFSASASQPWFPVALILAVLSLITGGYILLRKRKTA